MLGHVLKKLPSLLISLLISSLVIFALLNLMPGDPLDELIGTVPGLTPADIEKLRKIYGLDRPFMDRYLEWVMALAKGDLGISRSYQRPVSMVIFPFLKNTLILSLTSLILSFVVGLAVCLWARLSPKKWKSALVNLICTFNLSMPTFWLGMLLILAFAVWLGVLPAAGTVSLDEGGGRLLYLILPTLTLSSFQCGHFISYLKNELERMGNEDYLRTAQAKGLSLNQALLKHGLKNVMIPTLAVVFQQLGGLFSGAVITETVFSYQGMGRLMYKAIIENDFHLAMAGLVVIVFCVQLMNLLADLSYAWADPRVKL